MIALVVILLTASPGTLTTPRESGQSYRILFLGNSHTASGDVPSQVKKLIEAAFLKAQVETRFILGAFLNDIALKPETKAALAKPYWTHVVLQAAKLSSSHKFQYSHKEAIAMAKRAKAIGAKVLLFAEWPRQGWSETEYILEQYRMISEPSQAHMVPVCKAWDAALKADKSLNLWAGDGNHSSPLGAQLASLTLAGAIADRKVIDEDRASAVGRRESTVLHNAALAALGLVKAKGKR